MGDKEGFGAAVQAPAAQHKRVIPEGIVELMCKWVSEIALIVMLVTVGVDIFTRWLLNFSFEISDEIGGYMLATITFLSLSVCQVNDSFHHVELIQARLSPRGRALSAVIFDLLALAFVGVMLWQLTRLEVSTWRFGDHAPTYLETPLWLPRLVMPVGIAAMFFSMCRTLAAHWRRFRLLTDGEVHGA